MDIDNYARRKQIALAQSIISRSKIYLDVRFWIFVRDADVSEEKGTAEAKLLQLLRGGVAAGTFVCPISESTFIEVMKQANTPTRRIATARLIDELSLGVSLTPGQTRIATEIAHFLHAAQGLPLYELQELAWTKLSYTLGYLHPLLPDLDQETQFVLQARFFDLMWEKSLSAVVAIIGDQWLAEAQELRHSAAQLNLDIKAHASKLVSYEHTYWDEIVGCLDVCADLCADVIAGMRASRGLTPPEQGSDAWDHAGQLCRNHLITEFENSATKQTLRTIHAQSSLHAALCWDRRTNFTANHFYDFEHAAAALAYCDVFLTEAYLAQIANAGHTKLCDLNGCQVTDDVERAVTIVQGLRGDL
ncbi:MAG: hypothetical protein WC068_13925 [Caulobacter sp.]